MRVRVDCSICQGHTLCNMSAPDIFKLGADDGHAFVEDEHVAPERESEVLTAAAGCPELAIVIDADEDMP